MSDPFIDALHDRLKSASASGPGGNEYKGVQAAVLTRWWDEFVEVLGQKVGAWNERQSPRPPLNFTKQPSGAVHVWHRSAEATFTRDGDAVRASTRLGIQPERQAIVALRIADDGRVVAVADDHELRTPTAAAEHVLTPVLVETFTNP